ncbi:MAG TPA: adenylate/guanylate cyclase domain-containing protein [Gaiellaceae bacterium]
MAERPTGTVTFLFTDIAGSTHLLRELGDDYGAVLEDHRRLLRAVFRAHDGFEVDTQGDAFFVAFSRAQDAATAAEVAQRSLETHTWPGDRNVRVRMGIHTCEADATAEGYVGIGVHRGARICAAGHGGQILVSHTTRDLLEDEEARPSLSDLGEHRLKDLTEPQRLYQLTAEGLRETFPPLRTLENRPTNLPVQPTVLIGREREVTEICELLRRDDVRLVTLTGPGGTGKTRLGLQAAAELVETFRNGVFFVPLAPITDPDLVVPTIAQTLGIDETSGQSLDGYLAEKHMLLMLDNVEQVLSSAADVGKLLSGAPEVKLVVTSREPFRLSAERVFKVEPLGLPDPKNLPDLAAVSQYEAVALFVERARAVLPSFEITNANAPAVAEICVRLDGLPLALELAAARSPLLSPEAMMRRLDERLNLLTAGARDLPGRHQTLRDTLAWSYDLLDENERSLFRRLGVFAGGFTLEAAEVVCDADLDTLGSLVDKSLVRRAGDRFTMLETIREYALDRLAGSHADEGLRARHARYFLDLAEEAYAGRIDGESEWSERLEANHDNLRAALEWLSAADPEQELQLAGALGWFWLSRSHLLEGHERLSRFTSGQRSDRVQARALTGAGAILAWQGDLEAAAPLLSRAIALWAELDEPGEQALALEALGWGCFFGGDDPSAREHFERSLELQTRGTNKRLVNRAQLAVCQIMVSQGDLEPADRLSRAALALAEEQDDAWAVHLGHHFLADCALIAADFDTAVDRYRRSLQAAVALGNRTEIALELQGVAMAQAGRSRPELALRLGSVAYRELSDRGVDITGVRFWVELIERHLGAARERLDPEAAAAAEQEGGRLSLEQAVEQALAQD